MLKPAASTPPRHPPVVIGGGMAGIVAALHLAERGLRPLLLEAGPVAGGRLAGGEDVTLEAAGHTFSFPGEHGIHAIWGQYRNLRALLA
ncbi:MAG TPA: FAD-dependent oxidoreductase, partial [Chloroflexia bacterium]|nr:FAD-dependent oxidoreductase [Chloroflexia bacterium]